jgi:hypothetical protein
VAEETALKTPAEELDHQADELGATADRLEVFPGAWAALNEAIAILRDAAIVERSGKAPPPLESVSYVERLNDG